MTVSALLLTNKERYTKVYIVENDSNTNQAIFTRVTDETIDKDKLFKEAKDYFLLDREGIDEIFGNATELNIKEQDMVLIIGL